MIDKIIGKKCTGCSACYNVCPQHCIIMEEDATGFYYPKVDKQKCIECKLCIKKCPVLNNKPNIVGEEKIYAAYSKDAKNRENSSSGGCFGEFAKLILNKKGIVFGAAFDNDFNLRHIYITKQSELKKIQGSKYVQSYIGNSYQEVKRFLDDGKLVLFSGTPCQIAGLKSFLGKEYEKLYTISVVCHGVPSKKKKKKYLDNYKENKLKNIYFRDKKDGWDNFNVKIELKNEQNFYIPAKKDIYMKAFLSNISLRESCYKCQFRDKCDMADITIGDFWGVNKIRPDLNDNKGISIIIARTRKGIKLIENCKNNLEIEEGIDKDEIIKFNPCIQRSVNRPKQRENFYKNIDNLSFEELVDKNLPRENFIKRVLKKVYLTYLRVKK